MSNDYEMRNLCSEILCMPNLTQLCIACDEHTLSLESLNPRKKGGISFISTMHRTMVANPGKKLEKLETLLLKIEDQSDTLNDDGDTFLTLAQIPSLRSVAFVCSNCPTSTVNMISVLLQIEKNRDNTQRHRWHNLIVTAKYWPENPAILQRAGRLAESCFFQVDACYVPGLFTGENGGEFFI